MDTPTLILRMEDTKLSDSPLLSAQEKIARIRASLWQNGRDAQWPSAADFMDFVAEFIGEPEWADR